MGIASIAATSAPPTSSATRARCGTTRGPRPASFRIALVRAMGGLPPSWLLSRRFVEVDDDLPDLRFGQTVFPRRHHGIPRRGFLREPRAPFRDPPEEVRLLKHRDGAGILEVRRRRVEPVREVTFAVEVVAVAVH